MAARRAERPLSSWVPPVTRQRQGPHVRSVDVDTSLTASDVGSDGSSRLPLTVGRRGCHVPGHGVHLSRAIGQLFRRQVPPSGAVTGDPLSDFCKRRTRSAGWVWLAWALACLAVAAWGLRWLVGPEIPPGIDVSGHLQRAEFAWDELFRRGRLDGWFPGSMLGYQAFLFYGPGLSLLVVAVQVCTLGTVSSAGALELVTVAGYGMSQLTVLADWSAIAITTKAEEIDAAVLDL